MSKWTHVNCIFRIDGIKRVSKKKLQEIFGKEFHWGHLSEAEEYTGKILPMGCEGTLTSKIILNLDHSYMCWATVCIFGDLRDYYDIEELKDWFFEVHKELEKINMTVRQAVIQIDTDIENETITYTTQDICYRKIDKRK